LRNAWIFYGFERGARVLGVRFLPKISVGWSVCARSGKKNRVATALLCVRSAGRPKLSLGLGLAWRYPGQEGGWLADSI
jgi:hypothetical protein